ncbi:hypothetical protein CsSME_00028421 [Camellia sinensis var. sinensis]
MDCFNLLEGSGECKDVSDLCLVRKILAPKALNRFEVSNILLGAWRTRAEVCILPWSDNIFLFQFSDAEDRRKVLSEAPWSIMGYLMVLQPLQMGLAAGEMEFRWCPF